MLNNESQIAHILNCVISDTIRAFQLVLLVPDSPIDYEIAGALWERALYKLAKLSDYVAATQEVNWRDRKRAEHFFNLESNTSIPHCDLAQKRIVSFLRKLRIEFSHGAQSNGVHPLRHVSINKGEPFLQCLSFADAEQCRYHSCPFKEICRRVVVHNHTHCSIAIADILKAIANELELWATEYDNQLSVIVDKRMQQDNDFLGEKPNPTIPWWFKPADGIFNFSL